MPAGSPLAIGPVDGRVRAETGAPDAAGCRASAPAQPGERVMPLPMGLPLAEPQLVDTGSRGREQLGVVAPLLSTQDVARQLGVTPRHVQRLILAGRLPAYNLGINDQPCWRVSPSALRLFKEQRRVRGIK